MVVPSTIHSRLLVEVFCRSFLETRSSSRQGFTVRRWFLSRSGTASSPIVIRAYPGDEGNVFIRGSDVVKGWTNDGGGVWSVPWQPLPLIVYPDGWPDVD